MKYRYTKFTGDDLDDLDLEELLSKLSDLLLSSGFDNPYGMPDDDERPGTARRCTTRSSRRCSTAACCPDETIEQLLGKDWQQADDAEARIEQLIQQIIEKLQRQGYITSAPDPQSEMQRAESAPARAGADPKRRSASRSPTRASTSSATARCATCSARSARAASAATTRASMATGVEASGAPKPYEFGDTLNLDASGTILNAVQRQHGQRREHGAASTSTTKT